MRYKLIAADMDDTLLTSTHTYTKRTVDAIKTYIQMGGRFVVATGRMDESAHFFYRENGLTGEIISYQGALVRDYPSQTVLKKTPMQLADAIAVSQYLDTLGVYHQLYEFETGRVITNQMDDYGRHYESFIGCKIKEFHGPIWQYLEKTKTPPLKMIVLEDPNNIAARLSDLHARFSSTVRVNTSKPFMIEIISEAANKGAAVDFVAKRYGIRQDEVLCIGDSMNDVPMLTYAGLGVAMGNATQAALAVADVVTDTNDQDGVAKAIEQYAFQ